MNSPIMLDEAEKSSLAGRKILAFIRAELVKLRDKNDGRMEPDKRMELIERIQVYKELERLWAPPKEMS